jgi:hypothetical protein
VREQDKLAVGRFVRWSACRGLWFVLARQDRERKLHLIRCTIVEDEAIKAYAALRLNLQKGFCALVNPDGQIVAHAYEPARTRWEDGL